MRKSISDSIVVSGGNKGVSPGTPNIGGGREMKNNARLSVAKGNNKGGIKMNIMKKVSREANKVKELKIYFKNLKTAMKNEEEYLEEYDFSKFPHSEEFYSFSREDVNMAILGISSAAVSSYVGLNSFIYDWNFMQLSEGTKEFVYYHELGHVMLKHNEKQQEDPKVRKAYMKAGAKGQVHRFEYEADFFAARVVGRWQALTALEEIRGSLGLASSELINKRIKVIWSSELD